jgi:hypothetical protein
MDFARAWQDTTAVQDLLYLQDEFNRVTDPISALPANEIVLPDDWVDQPVRERQRYTRAQHVLNAGRNYVDSGWQLIKQADDRAKAPHKNLVTGLQADEEKKSLEQAHGYEALVHDITAYETQLKDLEQRRAEIRQGKTEGKELDSATQQELSTLDLTIGVIQTKLSVKKEVLEALPTPEDEDRLDEVFRELLDLLKKSRDKLCESQAAAAARLRMRRILRWTLIIIVAMSLFLLGNISDQYLPLPVTIPVAIALWISDAGGAILAAIVSKPYARRSDH